MFRFIYYFFPCTDKILVYLLLISCFFSFSSIFMQLFFIFFFSSSGMNHHHLYRLMTYKPMNRITWRRQRLKYTTSISIESENPNFFHPSPSVKCFRHRPLKRENSPFNLSHVVTRDEEKGRGRHLISAAVLCTELAKDHLQVGGRQRRREKREGKKCELTGNGEVATGGFS